MTLLRFSVAAALVVALASAAPAQTVEDWTKNWNTHTPAEVIKPLDDLVPQDLGPDSTANLPDWIDTETAPQALPAEGADRAALAALFGETGATPVTAPAPAPTIAAIPDDWVT